MRCRSRIADLITLDCNETAFGCSVHKQNKRHRFFNPTRIYSLILEAKKIVGLGSEKNPYKQLILHSNHMSYQCNLIMI